MQLEHKVQWTPNTNSKEVIDIIQEIAGELAYNYLSSSFGDEDKPDLHIEEICHDSAIEKFKERFNRGERVRNILIIGAGASHDVFKCIPLGDGLIEEVKDEYEKEIKTIEFLANKFTTAESEIKDITEQAKLNFENYLYLLSEYFVTQKDLREKIEEMTGFRYSVSLFNEIVAHMLKHSFIDVIINMNFEETLDQAIEEEVGSQNYLNILSDGHCVELEDVLVDGRLKTPFYIKPHGTASHKSTLRFTNRHYLDLPDDIRKLLRALLSGKRNKKNIQRVNLICIGFALQSFELNKVINHSLPADSVIYHIGYDSFEPDKLENFLSTTFCDFKKRANDIGRIDKKDFFKTIRTRNFTQNLDDPLKGKVYPDVADDLENSNSDKSSKEKIQKNYLTSSLSELFSIIWREQYDKFFKTYSPRSIARHEIISYLLYEPFLGLKCENLTLKERKDERNYIKRSVEKQPKYFLDRLLIEIAIALNRGNGIVDVVELLNGRIGFYYKKYEEMCIRHPKSVKKRYSIYEVLNEFTDDNESLYNNLISKNQNTNTNLFVLKTIFSENGSDEEEFKVSVFKDLSSRIDEAFDKTEIKLHNTITIEEKKASQEQLKKSFLRISQSLYNKTKFKRTEDIKRRPNKKSDEFVKFDRTITLLSRLLTSKMLSNKFRLNFLKNHGNFVHNGKMLIDKNRNEDCIYNTMLEELFRLFSKSVGSHYFVISSLPKNPVHFLWESFSQKKLIHTNLALTYEFNNLFNRRDWDVVLSVSDTGSWLEFLRHERKSKEALKKSLENKKIILLCSYEHVQQLYPYEKDKNKLIECHKEKLCAQIFNKKNMELLFVPYNQHNNHVVSFLKAVDLQEAHLWDDLSHTWSLLTNKDFQNQLPQKVNQLEYIFISVGSIYLHRQGFSNVIDPLYIGLDMNEITNDYYKEDQIKILRTFVLHIARALLFRKAQSDGLVDNSSSFLKSLYQNEFLTNTNQVNNDHLNAFLSKLYTFLIKSRKTHTKSI